MIADGSQAAAALQASRVRGTDKRRLVPGEQDIRKGEPEYTGRLCVIGAELKENNIAALFGV